MKFPLLFTVVGVCVLLCLGTWQVFRLQEKNQYQAKISERIALPPMEDVAADVDLEANEYRRVLLHGRFLHDRTFYVFTGPIEHGGKPGFLLITPFERADGAVVLVDRGFVLQEQKLPEARPDTMVEGEVSLVGMLHRSEKKRRFAPEDDVAKNMWFTISVPRMEQAFGSPVAPYFVRVLRAPNEPKGLPVAGDPTIRVFNPHLEYAITWYALSVILGVIYVLFRRSQRRL